MNRIGLLGGTFDPVHKGHLAMARWALRVLQLDEIWFVPSLKTPLKDRRLTPFDIRVEMLQRALRPYRKMKICLIEQQLPTPSYTFHTVQALQRQFPQAQLTWIIGDDQAARLDQWYEYERLIQSIRFAVFSREGVQKKRPELIYIENFHHEASSTAVRRGQFSLTPRSVRSVIEQYGLYLDDIVDAYCCEKRARHCASMTALALELARAHGVDQRKTRIAGMLHDLAKDLDEAQAREWMKVYWPQMLDQSWKTWHPYIAQTWLKTRLYITDPEILEAVREHTSGKGKGGLAKIIYIADKIDPGRGYDIRRQKEVCLRDLDEGFALIRKEQQEYLRKEGVNV